MNFNYRWMCQIVMMTTMGAFLLGCSKSTPSPEQMDKSPFTGIPCAAPCWHELVIGESDESDVMSTLPNLSFIDQNSINIHRMSMPGLDPNIEAQGAEITASCIHPHEPCLTVTVADNLLAGINLVLNYEMRLDEARQYLGDPDYIGYRMMGAERVACQIDFVWVSKQLVLASKAFTGSSIYENCSVVRDTGKTIPNQSISGAKYMSPDAIDLLLSTGTGEFFKFSGTIPE